MKGIILYNSHWALIGNRNSLLVLIYCLMSNPRYMPDTSIITWGTAKLQSRFHFYYDSTLFSIVLLIVPLQYLICLMQFDDKNNDYVKWCMKYIMSCLDIRLEWCLCKLNIDGRYRSQNTTWSRNNFIGSSATEIKLRSGMEM